MKKALFYGVVFATVSLIFAGEPKTLTLQNGLEGYSGCLDSWIAQNWEFTEPVNTSETSNKSTDTTLEVLTHGGGCVLVNARALFKFTYPDSLNYKKVVSATLSLYIKAAETRDANIRVAPITTDWEINTVSWEKATALSNWQKTVDTAMDWDIKKRFSPDYDTAYRCTSSIATDSNYWVAIDITPIIKTALQKPAGDFGFVIMEGSNGGIYPVIIPSSEYPTTALRPKLQIRYEEITSILSHTPPSPPQPLTVGPRSGVQLLQISVVGPWQLTLTNLAGRTLYTQTGITPTTLPLSLIPTGGVVVARLSHNNGQIDSRIVRTGK